MTMAEIKSGIEQSSPEERVYLTAYLKHLARKDDPAYQSELTRLNAEIDNGKRISLAQAKQLHESLKAEGL
jgi:hypothetical protein